MGYPVKIAGRKVELAWTNESAKRFGYRMGTLGGEPTPAELQNPKTVTTALFKVLWGLLPAQLVKTYPDPEELFAAVDHEEEGPAIFEAIGAVYRDRFPTEEKKSTSKKSPSPESSSG